MRQFVWLFKPAGSRSVAPPQLFNLGAGLVARETLTNDRVDLKHCARIPDAPRRLVAGGVLGPSSLMSHRSNPLDTNLVFAAESRCHCEYVYGAGDRPVQSPPLARERRTPTARWASGIRIRCGAPWRDCGLSVVACVCANKMNWRCISGSALEGFGSRDSVPRRLSHRKVTGASGISCGRKLARAQSG